MSPDSGSHNGYFSLAEPQSPIRFATARAAESFGAPARPRAVLSLGKFDGVHAGHRHLAAHLLSEASTRQALAVALVLDPHPATVLRGESIDVLTTVPERIARLRALGVDRAELLAFTPDLASLSPDDFVDRLAAHFDVAALVVGSDFVFGHNRTGTQSVLAQLAAARGFEVVVVDPLAADGEPISTGRVKELVSSGDVAAARTCLRNPPVVRGTVVRGAARGRGLGYPTANLFVADRYVIPANGIYAVSAEWTADEDRRKAFGVASSGVRPTFDNGERWLEVFLLDVEHGTDLYGVEMTLSFLARQRDELRFEHIDKLVTQMALDVTLARTLCDRERALGWSEAGPESGGNLTCSGYDMADLLTRLSDGSAPPGAAAESSGRSHPDNDGTHSRSSTAAGFRRVDVAAPTELELAQAWLDALDGAPGSAYHAAAKRALGIIWSKVPGAGPEGERGTHVAGDYKYDPDLFAASTLTGLAGGGRQVRLERVSVPL
jgi:riboflavin kinase/FMN adenylyltransferase